MRGGDRGVQGREAEAVIFVLGAPLAQQRGARGWAGGQPNLLNVAITRAQERLYVIGNRKMLIENAAKIAELRAPQRGWTRIGLSFDSYSSSHLATPGCADSSTPVSGLRNRW